MPEKTQIFFLVLKTQFVRESFNKIGNHFVIARPCNSKQQIHVLTSKPFGTDCTKISDFGILPKYNGRPLYLMHQPYIVDSNIAELKTHALANKHFQDHNSLYQPVLKLLLQQVKPIDLTLEAIQS